MELDFHETKSEARTCADASFQLVPDYPFKDLTPDLLKRPFIIDNRLNQASSKWVLNPMALLMENSGWKKLINNYALFRSDMKVRILIKSSPALFGYLRVVSIYGEILDWIIDVRQINTGDTYISSVASSESLEITIPYRSFKPYYSIFGDGGFGLYHHLYFSLDVAHVMEAEATLSIQTIVELENPMAAGPCCFQVQSGKTRSSGYPTSNFGGATLINGLYNVASTFNGIGLSEIGTMYTAATAAAGVVNQMQQGIHNNTEPEPEVEEDPDFVGEQSHNSNYGQQDGGASGVKQSLYGSFNGNHPTPSINRLGGPIVANTLDGMFGDSNLKISDLIKIPSLVHSAEITNVGEIYSFDHFNQVEPTWLSYMSRFFRVCHGSIKLSFHFFTSPLVAARYSITTSYSEDTIVQTDPNNFEGPSQNFLVRNDVVKTCIIPFHAFQNMISNDKEDEHAKYCKFLLQCIQKPNQPAVGVGGRQKCKIFMSGCEDFTFSSLRHGISRYVAPDPPLVFEVQSLRALHASDCGDSLGTLNYSMLPTCSPTVYVNDIFRSWDNRPAFDSSVITRILPAAHAKVEADFNATSNLDQVAALFYLTTGGYEFKVGLDKPAQGESYAIQINPQITVTPPSVDDFRIANGMFLGRTDVWPVADFVAPYISEYPLVTSKIGVYPCRNAVLSTNLPVGALDIVATRGADDFKCYMPQILPPSETWWPVRE